MYLTVCKYFRARKFSGNWDNRTYGKVNVKPFRYYQHFTLDFDYDTWTSPLGKPSDNMERHIEIALNYLHYKRSDF